MSRIDANKPEYRLGGQSLRPIKHPPNVWIESEPDIRGALAIRLLSGPKQTSASPMSA